ncbi:lactonase family protein [Acidobacteria bacterium AB60]|nr:lactonase family protein [Acidobacteria bacterium AB60]
MKLKKKSQLLLAAGSGLIVASLLSACQLVTIDYLFVAGQSSITSSGGGIQVLAIDSQSGALRFAADSDKHPFDPGGAAPVAMVTSTDFANLYVANADTNSVVHFSVAANGALTKKDSITLPAAPAFLAVNQANNALYVVSGTTSATLTAYPLSSGAIGNPVASESLSIPGFTGDTVVPTGVTALPNNSAVYATVYDKSAYNPGGSVSSNANPGWVFGFTVGSGGALTPLGDSPYRAGVKPSALAADPTNRFVYVTDFASNQLIGYAINSNDGLSFLISGPYKTANEPAAISIDPRGRFIYVADSLDSQVGAYAIDLATGIPSLAINTTGSQTNNTDTQPVAILVDPALGRFVFTANNTGNSLSGFRLNPTTGTLVQTQATPYPTLNKPSAIASIPHGNHSIQVTTP